MTEDTGRSWHRRPIAVVVRAGVGLVVLVVAIGIASALVLTKPPPPRSSETELAMTVQTITVGRVEAPWQWTGYGTTRAKNAADVAAEVWGVVAERPERVDPGRWIDRGGMIVGLDRREYADQAERARGVVRSLEAEKQNLDVELESLQETLAFAVEALELNERELERLRGAVERGSASRFEVEAIQEQLTRDRRDAELIRRSIRLIPQRRSSIEARLASENAALRLAELDLERTAITAPIDGVMQQVMADVGDRVNTGEVVARVVDLRTIEAPLRLPVSALGTIGVGDEVTIRVSADRGGEWTGRVSRIAPEADPATRTITVFVDVEQTIAEGEDDPTAGERLLLPGQFVVGLARSSGSTMAVVAPRSAVNGDRVLVVGEGNRARSIPVRIERRIDAALPSIHPDETQWVVVSAGLVGGERLIVSNLDDLAEGAAVTASDVGAALASDARSPDP